ncbi:MAG: hypothetical protein DI539_00290 [Flavobacterium psychrophilum]|nr:MAG: hypothetical protein DI539_00290 [Flavobacterium psychrophilum]
MQPLITRNDIAKYRQISKSPNDAKLNEMILDAQMLDLQPLIGESLYNKLLSTPEEYQDLLEGGIYEEEGIDYTNYGLKMVLAYFAYARHIMFSSVTDTAYSVVEKLNDNSRPADVSSKKTIYNLNREASYQIWENVKQYLIRIKHPDFGNCQRSTKKGLRFKKIV